MKTERSFLKTFDLEWVLEKIPGHVREARLGFGVNDIIDLTGLTFAKNAKVSYNPNTDQLAVTSGAVTDTLTVVALPGGTTFAISSDGALGTDITLIGIATSGHGHHA